MKPRSNIRPDSANSHRSSYSDGSRPSTSAQQHKMGGRPASAQSDRFARSRDTPTEAKPAKHVNGRPSPSAFNSNPSHIRFAPGSVSGRVFFYSDGVYIHLRRLGFQIPLSGFLRRPCSSSNVHIEDVGVFVSSVSLAMEQLSVQQITEEMNNFAENIGINHLNEPELMYIAEDFYSCPLPEGWSEFWTDDDLVYYAFQGHTQVGALSRRVLPP